MPDLRVGVLAPDLTYKHGWAQYSLSVIDALRRAGVRLTVIAARNSPPEIDALRLLPAVDPLDRGMVARLAAVYPRVRAALKSCHVIHALIEPYAPLAAAVAEARPLVITGHGSYVRAPRPAASRALYTWAFRRGLIVCVSRYTAQVTTAAIPGADTRVIPNGIDFERFGAIQPVGAPMPTVLSVGAVKARKGTLELVRALARVREAIPTVRGEIIGSLDLEPETVERVRAAIRDLDLADHVALRGRIPDADLLRAYAAAAVFAMPSVNVDWKFEGFGLTLLEASAAGLPVIGSRGCGAEDAVQDGVTGLLVPQGADMVPALTAAITRLLTDRALAAGMGAAGRAWAAAHTWDHAAARLVEVYEQISQRGRRN
jgi:phosphatidylinositol alpha-1,6-mannosyltransferase